MAIGVYVNTFTHGFVLDDDVVFLKNSHVQEGVSAIPKIVTHGFLYGFNQKNDQSYRPFVLINFAIEKSVFGNNPKVLHGLNAFYYGILACLLFWFLHVLFKRKKPWLVFWISLLFVLHPIHTEVVANIKGRDEIFHAIFLILSFIFALKYIDSPKIKNVFISLITYFIALLCKEMAVTYIALLPLTIWMFRSVKIKKLSIFTIYFIGVLCFYFILRNAILDTVTFEESMSVMNNGLAAATNYPDQLATNFSIFGNYIKLLFFPHPLTWDYSFPHFPIQSFTNPIVILIVVVLIILTVLSIRGLRSKNKLAYCFLFFIISFSIVSNFFILIGATLGERFLFFPSIAFCIFLVLLLEKIIRLLKLKKDTAVLTTLVLSVAVLYAFKTIDRNKDWVNNEQLFISGAVATPNNSRAVLALGSIYRERAERSNTQQEQINNYLKAIEQYNKSIVLYPKNTEAHYNLGVIYMNTNQNDKAKEAFKAAVSIDSNYISALNNLGFIAIRESNYSEAERMFLRCLEINESFQDAHANLGVVYHNIGSRQKAEEYYKSALALDPNDVTTKTNLKLLIGPAD
ncbi:tetratricopeptide repeat protein [Aquimarina sp. 2201CG14-23]|uniref:tetratricopeptide repeat protein n=1 Tax=Aquimarina mycalae TaxID=3040073 RepID=UPI002478101F|nr:tetratricopeptide repeat protein [Aquimarina sp. 2201CG14-23]MDH7445154.1 tetratricopeptide repeat protein [Aquimarina sp. 2201CG14-23]